MDIEGGMTMEEYFPGLILTLLGAICQIVVLVRYIKKIKTHEIVSYVSSALLLIGSSLYLLTVYRNEEEPILIWLFPGIITLVLSAYIALKAAWIDSKTNQP